MSHLPRYSDGHTFEPGQCRHAVQPARRFAPRVGHRPRDPARPAQAEPTARFLGTVPGEHEERRELGAEGEEQAIRRDERRQAEVDDEFDRPADLGAARSSDPAGSAEGRRGPDTQPRVRRTWADTGAGAGEGPDWSSFDIGRTVRALKVCTQAQARLRLRTLHLRWWHAQAATMKRILRRSGGETIM